ncbi:MAG: glycosyltransferase family 9 protein [Desulfatibacillum sp.]|nr:glycosyltransferase family 9 protein [Desulfatibacillum sp.]
MTKVLVIKMTALGDVAAALAPMEQICRHHAGGEIWLLTSPEAKSLFAHHPFFQVRTVNRDNFFGRDGVFSTIKWVRAMGFDRIFDLQGNKVSYRLCKWSKSPERIGTQPNPAYTKSVPTKWVRTVKHNVITRLNKTLAAGGINPATEPGPLYASKEDIQGVAMFKSLHGLKPKHFAVLHAGSSPEWLSKRWPADYFAQLIEMMELYGISCVMTGSPVERDINARITVNAGIDATGVLSVRQLYVLARDALFAVSNDSAPMHVFSQTGIPVFALFGPTNYKWSHGFNQRANVVTVSMPCSPCFKATCPPDKGHVCMENLTPDLVFARIIKKLGESGKIG